MAKHRARKRFGQHFLADPGGTALTAMEFATLDELSGGLRKPLEQRVERRGHRVGAEPAGDARERRRDPGQRMSSGRVKYHAADRNQSVFRLIPV